MLFNSYTFFIFLAFVLSITRLNWPWRGKKLFLLICSYLFYAAWNPPFVLILWISTLGDWWFAKFIHEAKTRARRRAWLSVSLLINLGMLCYFKYSGFAVDTLVSLAHQLGVIWTPAKLNIILPVGISFSLTFLDLPNLTGRANIGTLLRTGHSLGITRVYIFL